MKMRCTLMSSYPKTTSTFFVVSVGSTKHRSLWRRFLVICGLSAAAVSAPLLDIYGRNPEVFVANRSSGLEIVLFAVIVAFALPLLSLGLMWVAESVGGRAPSIVYMVLVVLLAGATGFVISRQIFSEDSLPAFVTAIAITLLVVLLHRWFGAVLMYFALALPVALVLFVSTSASARLIWQEPEAQAGTSPIGQPAPLVLIQLDEMPIASIMERDGTVNEVLFPNFARLAEEGTWYRNAMASSIATTQSIPAILTGKLGEKGLSPSSVDHPENLFTLLSGSYDMHVIEWVADMCPEEICPDYAGRAPAHFTSLLRDISVVYGHLTLPATMREQLPSIENAWKGFLGDGEVSSGSAVEVEGLPVPRGGERVEWVDWVQRLANGIDRDAPPTLHYAHLEAPHVPWVTNPSGTHYQRPEEYTEVEGVEGDGRWTTDPRPPLIGFQRHLYQTGFLDRVLGRLFDRMDEAGIWSDSMVIVVADHGASFVPGEHRRWPYEENRDDLYRVPFFIKYPDQRRGDVVDAPVYGIDIMPTIVDALGVQTDWDFDGISLLEIGDLERPHEPIWWCCNGEGVSTDLDVLYSQVERNHQWVPDQSSWQGVAGAGPHADLLGEPAATLDVSEDDQMKWSLELGSSLADLALEKGMVQTFLTGRIELPPGIDGDEILVVVNGEVAGTGYVARDSAIGGAIRALISENLVREGHNEVEILVSSGGSAWLAGSPDVITFELLTADGRQLDVAAEGNRRVQVDDVAATADGWRLTGWSADVSRKETPDMIYVYAGQDLVAFGPTEVENRNVVRWFNSEDLLLSGFSFEIEAADVPAGVEQLTVAAEFGEVTVADPVSLPGR